MRSDIVPGAIFSDYELSDHTAKRRKLSERVLTRDEMLDDITLYWLTGGSRGERPRGPGGRAALSDRSGRRIDQSARDTRRKR